MWETFEQAKPDKIWEELADMLLYAFQLADKYSWDIAELIREKLARNAEKYLADKAKGTAAKYNKI
ncbi:MazG-like family protein [Hymenobacter sp. BT559]|uniref:MazG-like family protein n=1 Tax=Hymenobacter sp. BT559 TaxID=2795729 RepID=UPI0018EC61D7|nr:MazG-like family protein [Hymenobacter sp. BT559]MBJ6146289.1 hypothetical protein [Hymenobacter sp. BT559]